MMLISSVIFQGGTIPHRYTCDGSDISPPLGWSGVSDGTKSLVQIVDGPDAPDPAAPRMIWAHRLWEAIPARRTHRYFYKLYALDAVLPDLGRPTRAAVEKAMQGHILGHAELMGQYQRNH